MFDYNCKKVSPMIWHDNTKHSEQKCKICGTGVKTSIDLVCHVAQEHHVEKEVGIIEKIKHDQFQDNPKMKKYKSR